VAEREEASRESVERIEQRIFTIRGERVIVDSDLAELYEVQTKALVKAVMRNLNRFPSDFMFQLSEEEFRRLRFQFGTSNRGRGGRRYRPYAFTEQGVAMLSSVLRSERAVEVNIEIVRTFVRLRQLLVGSWTLQFACGRSDADIAGVAVLDLPPA
jgi:ORF6N domain-containing protein